MQETHSNNSSPKKLKLIGKILFTATFIVVVSMIVLKEYESAKLKKLNYFMPRSYEVLFDVEKGREKYDKAALRHNDFYYGMLSRYNPSSAAAFGLKGFCSYYLGKESEAIASYEKAAKINPHFFWYHYNLGLIYFNKGDYQKAAESLSKAVATKPDFAVVLIRSSKRIYLPIALRRDSDPRRFVVEQLTRAHHNARKLIVLSHYHLKNYPEMLRWVNRAMERKESGGAFFLYYAGLGSYELRNYQKSVYFLQESLKRVGNQGEIYQALARTWQTLGDKNKANALLQRGKILSRLNNNSEFLKTDDQLQIY